MYEEVFFLSQQRSDQIRDWLSTRFNQPCVVPVSARYRLNFKLKWHDADLNLYANHVRELLSQVDIPTELCFVKPVVLLIILYNWKNIIVILNGVYM